jgi:ferrous-iron efflux pump FieF
MIDAVDARPKLTLVQRLHRRATEASLAVAAVLISAKLAAYVETGSVSVLSTAFDSMLDGVASLLNLVAVRHAQRPADEDHRFGHGKAEPLAGLGQTVFIAVSAALLLNESVDSLLHPKPVEHATLGIAVAAASILITYGLLRFQHYVLRKSHSVAVAADEMHYRGDLYLNLGVVVSLVLGEYFHITAIDPLFGIGIGVWLVVNSWQIFQQSFNMLMDRELPDEDRERIRSVCMAHEDVLDVYDIRTRKAGPLTFIHLTLEMNGDIALKHAHRIGETVEGELEKAFPGAEVIIHEEPRGVESRRRKDR